MTLFQLIGAGYNLETVFALYFAGQVDRETYRRFLTWWTGEAQECSGGEDEPDVTREEARERR